MRKCAAKKRIRKPKAAVAKESPEETKPDETRPKETKATSTKVAAISPNDLVKLTAQFRFEGIKDEAVMAPAATVKPSKVKGLNNRGFYPPTPSKHVNQHVRSHHFINQPRKITHSKLGVA